MRLKFWRRDEAHAEPPAPKLENAPAIYIGGFQVVRFVQHPDMVGMVIHGNPPAIALISPNEARTMGRQLFETARLAQESVPLDEI